MPQDGSASSCWYAISIALRMASFGLDLLPPPRIVSALICGGAGADVLVPGHHPGVVTEATGGGLGGTSSIVGKLALPHNEPRSRPMQKGMTSASSRRSIDGLVGVSAIVGGIVLGAACAKPSPAAEEGGTGRGRLFRHEETDADDGREKAVASVAAGVFVPHLLPRLSKNPARDSVDDPQELPPTGQDPCECADSGRGVAS